jgi:hypothetical protein
MRVEDAIERWTPDPVVRSRHARAVDVEATALWDAARSVTLSDTRTLGRLVRWRIPGTPGALTFSELFERYPFTVLDAGEGYSVSGLCGQIWTLQRDYPALDGPEDFEAWDKRGTVKVVFAHWVRPAEGGAELVSEARVSPIGRFATMQTRALWAVVGRFERLVGAEPLAVAARRAAAP